MLVLELGARLSFPVAVLPPRIRRLKPAGPAAVDKYVKRLVLLAVIVVLACNRGPARSRVAVSSGVLQAEPPPASRLIVIGDSVAYGAGDESGRGGLAGRLGARNAGVNGARTRNVLALLEQPSMQSALGAAKGVVLSIGGNDLYGDSMARAFTTILPGLAMQMTLRHVTNVVERIEHANPRLHIYLLGLYDAYHRRDLDVRVAAWNALLLERFAADEHVTVVPIADLFRGTRRLSPLDHFHPSAEAYARIARRIEDDF
jgi:lysophospholipase L1-like esterase